MELKVILPARHIPNNATVTKVTGEKRYTIRAAVHYYSAMGRKDTIVPSNGHLFIVASNGDINEVTLDQRLCWCANVLELHEHLTEIMREGITF